MGKLTTKDYFEYLEKQHQGASDMIMMLQAMQERISIPLCIIDMCDGVHGRAAFLSQVLYWSLPNEKKGAAKMQYHREGHYWIVKRDNEWHEECRVTERAVRDHMAWLLSAGLLISQMWLSPFKEHRKSDGAKNLARHIRINWPIFSKAIKQYTTDPVTDDVTGNPDPVTDDVTGNPDPVTDDVTPYISVITKAVNTKEQNNQKQPATALVVPTDLQAKDQLTQADPMADLFTLWQNNIGVLNSIVRDQLLEYVKDGVSVEWIKEAVTIAVNASKRRPDYVYGIINKWVRDGKQDKKAPATPPAAPVATGCGHVYEGDYAPAKGAKCVGGMMYWWVGDVREESPCPKCGKQS